MERNPFLTENIRRIWKLLPCYWIETINVDEVSHIGVSTVGSCMPDPGFLGHWAHWLPLQREGWDKRVLPLKYKKHCTCRNMVKFTRNADSDVSLLFEYGWATVNWSTMHLLLSRSVVLKKVFFHLIQWVWQLYSEQGFLGFFGGRGWFIWWWVWMSCECCRGGFNGFGETKILYFFFFLLYVPVAFW